MSLPDSIMDSSASNNSFNSGLFPEPGYCIGDFLYDFKPKDRKKSFLKEAFLLAGHEEPMYLQSTALKTAQAVLSLSGLPSDPISALLADTAHGYVPDARG